MTDTSPSTDQSSMAALDNRALGALLKRYSACDEASRWIGDRDAQAAWNECERADWMIWLLGRLKVDQRLVVRTVVAIVQPVMIYVPADETRPQEALNAASAWADDPSEENRQRVKKAAAAADAADAANAAYAAYAAYFASTAAAYATASAVSVYAAAAAAFVVSAVSVYATRAEALRQSAQTVRDIIPFSVVLAAVQP